MSSKPSVAILVGANSYADSYFYFDQRLVALSSLLAIFGPISLYPGHEDAFKSAFFLAEANHEIQTILPYNLSKVPSLNFL